MFPFTGLDQVTKRYLTLTYGVILGFAVILAAWATVASGQPSSSPVDIPADTQVVAGNTAAPYGNVTEQHLLSKPSAIPNIPPTPNEVTPSNLGVTSAELNGLQVKVWYPWTGSKGAAFQALLDEFSSTNQWGIKAVGVAYEGFGRMEEAVDSAVTNATLPDVLVDYGYQAQHWDESSLLADLTPYVNDPLWGMSKADQADFYPAFWAEDLVRSDGANQARRLGIPFYRSAYVLLYNESWAKELGYTSPPANPEDLRLQACAAAAANGEQAVKSDITRGGLLITPQPGFLVGWIYAFGGNIINPNSPTYQLNNAGTEQAFSYLKGLLESGCAWFDPAADPSAEFANRRALFAVASLFDLPAQEEALANAGSLDEWTVLPFPSRLQPVVDTYGPSLMITQADPAKQLAAWLVVKWLVYPTTMADWVSAIEAYPTRKMATDLVQLQTTEDLEWHAALTLLPDARSEPILASWSVVRWILNDALSQLVSTKFTSEQIPALIDNMDSTAAEIFDQVR